METCFNSSLFTLRLVRLLSDLDVIDLEADRSHFAERFGQLIDFSGSITLSKVHEELSKVTFKPSENSANAIIDDFLGEHKALVSYIAKSFIPGSKPSFDDWIVLPTPKKLHVHFQKNKAYTTRRPWPPRVDSTLYEPYRNFYHARQGVVNSKILKFRWRIEEAISGISPQHATLLSLDRAFQKVLSTRSHELFAVVPKLLGKRFSILINEHWQELPSHPDDRDLELWMKPGGWISTFCGHMQTLLLAELEVRLQPLLGLIESLSESPAPVRRFQKRT